MSSRLPSGNGGGAFDSGGGWSAGGGPGGPPNNEGGGQPVAVVPRETPLQALKQRCAGALGDDFPAVYSYLKTARQQNEADGVVRRNLLGLVGNARLGDCMWVDQLIFKEELASTPASPRR